MGRRRKAAAAATATAAAAADPKQIDFFDPVDPVSPVELDLGAGRAERDRGMARVDAHSIVWRQRARDVVEAVLPQDFEGPAELIRVLVLSAGVPQPHHPNCWGSLTSWALKRGLLVATGELDQMKDPRSHARYTKVYRRAPLVS